MEVSLDHYVRNFRIFYQQLARGHRKEQSLNQQFKTLIEGEQRKWRKIFSRDDTKTVSDNTLLNKVRQARLAKEKGKIEIDALYASNSLENAVVFGYLLAVMEQNDVTAFTIMQEGFRDKLTDRGKFTQSAVRKINFVWGKLEQIISGKRKVVRFEKQLQEYFKEIPVNFLSLLYSIITHQRILVSENKSMYFGELTNILNMRVDYFELSPNDILKTTVYGEQFKACMRLGYLAGDQLYVFVTNLPQKQQIQLNKEITLDKFSNIAAKLSSCYSTNMKDYLQLNNLKHRDDTKDSKISSQMFVGSTSKIASTEFMAI